MCRHLKAIIVTERRAKAITEPNFTRRRPAAAAAAATYRKWWRDFDLASSHMDWIDVASHEPC